MYKAVFIIGILLLSTTSFSQNPSKNKTEMIKKQLDKKIENEIKIIYL